MKIPLKYTTENGLLYCDGQSVQLPEADRIARQYGFMYVEQMVKHLEEVKRG